MSQAEFILVFVFTSICILVPEAYTLGQVGDNVGDCAARGADLFESIAAEIISAMILGGTMAKRCKLDGQFICCASLQTFMTMFPFLLCSVLTYKWPRTTDIFLGLYFLG